MNIPTILTVPNALDHLGLIEVQNQLDIELKLAAATQLVCEYIADRQPADEDWIAEIEAWSPGSPEAPNVVKLAVLTQVAEFYRFRGDDLATDRPPTGDGTDLSPLVKRLLHRYRSPVLA